VRVDFAVAEFFLGQLLAHAEFDDRRARDKGGGSGGAPPMWIGDINDYLNLGRGALSCMMDSRRSERRLARLAPLWWQCRVVSSENLIGANAKARPNNNCVLEAGRRASTTTRQPPLRNKP